MNMTLLAVFGGACHTYLIIDVVGLKQFWLLEKGVYLKKL